MYEAVTAPVHNRESPLPPWGLPEALGGLALAVVIYLIPGSFFYVLTKHWSTNHQLLSEIIGYFFLVLGVVVASFVLIVRRFPDGLRQLGYRFPGWDVLARAALSIVPIFVGIALVYWLFSHLFPGFQLQGNAKQSLPVGHKAVPFPETLGLILFAGVLVPLTEETLFRGIVFGGLARFFSGLIPENAAVFVAAVASGAIFGLAHLEPHTFPILMFLGICLAYIYYYGRSVFASAIVHGLFNTIAVLAVVSST